MKRAFWLALAALPLAQSALAAGACPALPSRTPMPREAQAAVLDQANWPDQVAGLQARLPTLDLAGRRLVFIGDSITAAWDPAVFGQFFGQLSPLLLGISGDFTQGVLQRLPAEWGPLQPRVVVLLIGTNNTQWGQGPPEDVALGIAEIIRLIHARSPGAKVLLLGILPRGPDASEPLRAVNARVNALIARCADNKTVFYLDAGPPLLDAGGRLTGAVSFDMLHFTPAGYAILARTIAPAIHRLMGG